MYSKYITKKKILLFAAIMLFFIALQILLIVSLQILQIKKHLTQKITVIQKDVKIKDGKWNLSLYNADPQLIGTYPLYFFTLEGFVLDRRSPIPGFLDTSDFKQLLLYKKPQTVTTITNQTRRIASKPIMQNGKPIAVIAASYFEPEKETLPDIDEKLANNLNYIHSKIQIKKGDLSLKNLDERYIAYDVSFVIVDSYNNILKKTNNINSIKRIPNFIDPSYIKPLIKQQRMHIVYDASKNEHFLLVSQPITRNGAPTGVVVIGQSLAPILSLLPGFILGEVILFIFFFSLVIFFIFKIYTHATEQNLVTNQVIFNEKKGVLIIGKKEIEIPYATNQYYLVQSLFTHPKKRFETDELLKRFGEDADGNNWRKVYDTMIKVNKKVLQVFPKKLIHNQNKTYQLNPTIEAIKQST